MQSIHSSNVGRLCRGFAVALALAVTGSAAADDDGWSGGGGATCTISPQNPSIDAGDSVNWSASYTGFSRTPNFSWTFEGGDPSASTSRTRTVSYASGGTFTTTLTLSRRGTTATCSYSIKNTCSASITL